MLQQGSALRPTKQVAAARTEPRFGITSVSTRYRVAMAMTLRLDADDHQALRERAEADGISMQDAARAAIRSYIERGEHRARVSAASELILSVHAEAIERLGE